MQLNFILFVYIIEFTFTHVAYQRMVNETYMLWRHKQTALSIYKHVIFHDFINREQKQNRIG